MIKFKKNKTLFLTLKKKTKLLEKSFFLKMKKYKKSISPITYKSLKKIFQNNPKCFQFCDLYKDKDTYTSPLTLLWDVKTNKNLYIDLGITFNSYSFFALYKTQGKKIELHAENLSPEFPFPEALKEIILN